MCEFRAIPANDLSDADARTWLNIHNTDARFSSPFFHPEFTKALACVRDDIQVVVLYDDGKAVGFLPVEVGGLIGRPAGYPVSSYHALVTQHEGWEAEDILAAAGINQLRFDHWISEQLEVQPAVSVHTKSAVLDLSDGFEGFCETKRRQGSKILSDASRRLRKLRREFASVECVATTSHDAIERLVKWNSMQCQRTEVANLFDFTWPADLLRELVERADANFGGIVCELRVDGEPIAVNYMLRSSHVAHGWFMAFDWERRRCSPGTVLLHEMLRMVAGRGVTQIDLGTGRCDYKARLMTHAVDVGEGAIDSRVVRRAAWGQWLKTRDWVRKSEWRQTAHRLDRWLTNTRRIFGAKA